ncbi:MAG: hypothetical protein AAF628_14470 [Planctomycetota bacterium]
MVVVHPDWDLLVLIQARSATGKVLGTGYPIGPDLILTAAHVLRRHGKPDSIELRFVGTPPDRVDEPWQPDASDPYEGEVVWDGMDNDDVDAALVRVRGLAVGLPVPPMGTQPLADGARWVGRGFAAAGKDENPEGRPVRNPIGLQGLTYAEHRGCVDLSVEDAPKLPKVDWKGASGGPVFVGGRLSGVLLKVPDRFDGRLQAIAFGTLVAVPKFAALLHWDDGSWRNELRRHLRRRLNRPDALQALCDQPQAGQLQWDSEEQKLDAVVERLLGCSLATLIAWFNHAHNALYKADTDQGVLAAGVLIDVLLEVLPLAFEQGVAHMLRHSADAQGAWIALPVATATVAEIAHAAALHRVAQFDGVGPDRFPRGRPLVQDPSALETGIAESEQRFMDVLMTDLARVLDVEKDAEAINGELEHRAEFAPERCPHYLVFRRGKVGSDASVHFQSIRRRFPALQLLELSGGDKKLEVRQIASPLREMLNRGRPSR